METGVSVKKTNRKSVTLTLTFVKNQKRHVLGLKGQSYLLLYTKFETFGIGGFYLRLGQATPTQMKKYPHQKTAP